MISHLSLLVDDWHLVFEGDLVVETLQKDVGHSN